MRPAPAARASLGLCALLALAGGRLPAAGPAAAPAAEEGAPTPAEAPAEQRVERGPVAARLSLSPAEVRIGDPAVLELEVTAEPGVELLMPVFGSSLDRFDILAFVPSARVDEAGRNIATQRYTLLAPASGTHAIPSLAIEFVDRRPGQREAPDGEDAYELLTEPIELVVSSVVPAGAGDDLRPPLGPVAEPAAPALGWAAGAALALAAAGLLGWWLAARGRRAARRSAYELAAERLAALAAAPRPDPASPPAMDAFFVELSGIVRRYVEVRFGLHAPELTTEEFLDAAARTPDLTDENRRFLRDFLRRADRVKFARDLPDAQYVGDALDAVRSFLAATRAEAQSAAGAGGPGRGEAAARSAA